MSVERNLGISPTQAVEPTLATDCTRSVRAGDIGVPLRLLSEPSTDVSYAEVEPISVAERRTLLLNEASSSLITKDFSSLSYGGFMLCAIVVYWPYCSS